MIPLQLNVVNRSTFRLLTWILAISVLFPAIVTGAIHTPQSKAEFKAARDMALPGDTIILPAGELDWGQLYVGISGTAEAPITIQAPTIFATTLTGSSYFQLAGSHIVIKGFKFVETTGQYPVWLTTGQHNRVTQCYFREAVASSLLRSDPTISSDPSAGAYHRFDHNLFTATTMGGLTIVGHPSADHVGQNIIEYNIFRDAPRRRLGAESIILYALDKHKGYKTNTIVRYNVFDKWDADVETEIVTIKSGGNTFYRNVFAWCTGYFSLRRENENLVDSNLFFNNRDGIWIYGEDHVVINNIIENCDRRGLYLRNGYFRNSDGIEGRAAMNCLIANNTFLDVREGTFQFSPTSGTFVATPSGNRILNNILHASDATGPLVIDLIGFMDAGNIVDNNLLYSSNGNYGPTGTNPILAPAQLTGSGYGLFHEEGSPAIDAGLSLSEPVLDFFGLARQAPLDLGHHEYSAASNPSVTTVMPPIPPDRSGFSALPLEAAFTVYPHEAKAGEALNLDASISKGEVVNYRWDLGDGHVYEGPEGFYPYDWEMAGQKQVTLTVEDASGATHSTSLTVRVLPGDPDSAGWLNTGPWLGWVNIASDPWWWINQMARYAYVSEDSGWVFFPK